MESRLKQISWNVDEPTYRKDSALSYSTISRFDREGYSKLSTLFAPFSTPSTIFGNCVDTLITEGQDAFDKQYIVVDFNVEDSIAKVVEVLYTRYGQTYKLLEAIPDKTIIEVTEELKYRANWKPETRAKVIKDKGSELYTIKLIAGTKTIISYDTKQDVDKAVEVLRTSPVTADLFGTQIADVFDDRNTLIRDYQLKFRATIDEVPYRCMADLICTDVENKIIYPYDLKTSSHTEWEFYKSFVEFNYQMQARLYWKLIRETMDKDPILKDYSLANYTFVVVNRNTLTPLTWKYEDTTKRGTLYYGRNKTLEFHDPLDVGKELYHYLNNQTRVPLGIEETQPNDLILFLNKM